MILKFNVKNQILERDGDKNQILERSDENIVVGKSKNYLYCEFTFETSEWDNIRKFAIFKDQCRNAYNVLLENNKCLVPYDVLKGDFFSVSVYGGDLITTTELIVALVPSGYTTHFCKSKEGSRDAYVQLFEELNKKIDDIIYRNDTLYIYKDGKIVKSINILTQNLIDEIFNSFVSSELLFSGSYNDLNDVPTEFTPSEHTHITEDITDFEDHTAIEIKKGYRTLVNKIRTYGE